MAKHGEKDNKAAPAETGIASVAPKSTALVPGSNVPKGMELVHAEDLKLPQIYLVQGLSDVTTRGVARPGDIMDTISEEILNGDIKARKPVVFIPAMYFRRRVKWIPVEDGGGIDCDSRDSIEGSKYGACASCPHAKWGPRGEKNSKPACALIHCFLGHVEGREIPAIMDLSRSKEPIATRLLSVMAFSKTPELWRRKWQFGIKEEAAPNGTKYFGYEFSPLQGEPSAEDQSFSTMLYNLYQSKVQNLVIQDQKEDFEKEAAREGDDKGI